MAVERAAGGTSLIDVLDRVLDKGIVIDAWVRVSLVGIDLITVEARVVVASIDTYLKYSEAVGQVVAGVAARRRSCAAHQNVIAENAALRAELAATKARRDARGAEAARPRRRADDRRRSGAPVPPRRPCSSRRGRCWRRSSRSPSSCWPASTCRHPRAARSTGSSRTPASSRPSSPSPSRLSGQLLLVAEHGVSTAAIADFALSRDDDGASARSGR